MKEKGQAHMALIGERRRLLYAKRDKANKTGRGGGKPWLYYDQLDNIIGSSAAASSVTASCTLASESVPADRPVIIAPESESESEEHEQAAAKSLTTSTQQQPNKSHKRWRDEPPKWVDTLVERLESPRKQDTKN